MTNQPDPIDRILQSSLVSRLVTPELCQEISQLQPALAISLSSVLAFLGCSVHLPAAQQHSELSDYDCLRAIAAMLGSLGLNRGDPSWSSHRLAQLIDIAINLSEGDVGSLLRAVFWMLGEYKTPLTPDVRNMIKDVVVYSFVSHRKSFEITNWQWLVGALGGNLSPAQAYFLTLAIPPGICSDCGIIQILRALAGTK
jgi:hypothetical protein